jgi:hypothetical protein
MGQKTLAMVLVKAPQAWHMRSPPISGRVNEGADLMRRKVLLVIVLICLSLLLVIREVGKSNSRRTIASARRAA